MLMYKVMSIVVLLTSSFAFFISHLYASRIKHLTSVCSQDIVATICEIEEKITSSSSDDGGEIKEYFPVFLYSVNDKQYYTKSPVGLANGNYTLGEEIKIKCNPANPEEIAVFTDIAWRDIFTVRIVVVLFLISSLILWFIE